MLIEIEHCVNAGIDLCLASQGDTFIHIYNEQGKEIYFAIRRWNYYPSIETSEIISSKGDKGYITNEMLDIAIRMAYHHGGEAYIQI